LAKSLRIRKVKNNSILKTSLGAKRRYRLLIQWLFIGRGFEECRNEIFDRKDLRLENAFLYSQWAQSRSRKRTDYRPDNEIFWILFCWTYGKKVFYVKRVQSSTQWAEASHSFNNGRSLYKFLFEWFRLASGLNLCQISRS